MTIIIALMKLIQISTNMPGIGLLTRERHVTIYKKLEFVSDIKYSMQCTIMTVLQILTAAMMSQVHLKYYNVLHVMECSKTRHL